MSDQFIARFEFCLEFRPKGWAFCDGQLMAISQNNRPILAFRHDLLAAMARAPLL